MSRAECKETVLPRACKNGETAVQTARFGIRQVRKRLRSPHVKEAASRILPQALSEARFVERAAASLFERSADSQDTS